MTPAELKAAIDAAREFTVPLEAEPVPHGREIRLRLPTVHEIEVHTLEHGAEVLRRDQGNAEARAAATRLLRQCIERSVIGWQGITLADLVDGAPDVTLPYDAGSVASVLDARPEWAERIKSAFVGRMEARTKRMEAARKNLPRASQAT